MYTIFNNKNPKGNIILECNNCTYKIPAEQSVELPVFDKICRFSVSVEPITSEELLDAENPTAFTEKILCRVFGKVVDSVSRMTLNPQVTYEFDRTAELTQIDLIFESWSEFDGDVSLFLFESYPIFREFCRAESTTATLRVVETKNTNLKQFLKTARNWLLFLQFSSIFTGLLFFLPYYLWVRYFASDFHFLRVVKKLYNMTTQQRETTLMHNQEKEEIDKPKGCLCFVVISVLAVAVVLVAIEVLEKIVGLF